GGLGRAAARGLRLGPGGRRGPRPGPGVHGRRLPSTRRARGPRRLSRSGRPAGRAGEACREAGLGLAYHAHAFEYERIEGVRPIDVLLKETPKDLLGLELDTFWASIAGVDPVKMVESHSGRVPLVHLKDKAKGTPVQYDEAKVPKDAFKEIGRGEIDYAAFLPAAVRAGV